MILSATGSINNGSEIVFFDNTLTAAWHDAYTSQNVPLLRTGLLSFCIFCCANVCRFLLCVGWMVLMLRNRFQELILYCFPIRFSIRIHVRCFEDGFERRPEGPVKILLWAVTKNLYTVTITYKAIWVMTLWVTFYDNFELVYL